MKENKLVEDTTGANAPEIETTDENLSINAIFQQSALPSLAKMIASVVPISGPTGAIINIDKNSKDAIIEVLAVAQTFTATPTAANTTVYTLTIDGIDFSYTSDGTATVAEITAGLVLEINVTQTNGNVFVTAVDDTTHVTLTADRAGTAFTVTDTGAGTIALVETQINVAYVKPEDASENIKIVRSEVAVYPTTAIHTGITQEAVEDVEVKYGKESINIIGNLLRGLANDQENAKLITFLNAQCKSDAALVLTDSGNAELNLFEITQKVHQLILKINSLNLRSYQAFAVIPYIALAGIMGLNQYAGGAEGQPTGLLVAKTGQTEFFINPVAASITAYVGIRDRDDSGRSSMVFSPYTNEIIEAVNPDSGEITYHIYNRFALTPSPLHVTDNEMLYKFDITL